MQGLNVASRHCRNEEYHSTVLQKYKKVSHASLRQEYIESGEPLAAGGTANAAGVPRLKNKSVLFCLLWNVGKI